MKERSNVKRMLMVCLLGIAVAPFMASPLLGQPQNKDQQKCVVGINKSAAKVSKAAGQLTASCVKLASKQSLPEGQTIDQCISADAKGKVAKASAGTEKIDNEVCASATPSFGYAGAPAANAGAVDGETGLTESIFGADLAAAVIDAGTDPDGSKCQLKVHKSYQKVLQTLLKEFQRCAKSGLKAGAIASANDLEECTGVDPKGKVGKTIVKLADAASDNCGEVGVNVAFPGECGTDPDFALCVGRVVRCQACLQTNAADDIASYCDEIDDGVANASCIDITLCGNGTIEPGETCDDGNTTDGDCCSSECLVEPAAQACPDDGNVCTDDVCDGAGVCTHPANTDACDDGLFCNGADTCSGGSCSVHTGDPCSGGAECNDGCNETMDNCFNTAGTACTADANDCTDDVCDGAGSCTHPNSSAGTACGDPSDTTCTNPDTCDGGGSCLDNHESDGTGCDDGAFCNGVDTCASGSCSSSGDPCVGGGQCNEVCDEGNDDCFDPNGTVCDNGTPGPNDACDQNDDQCDGAGACVNLDPAEGPELCYSAGDEDCDGNADFNDPDADSICATNTTETCTCSDACEIRAIEPSAGASTSLSGLVPFSAQSAGDVTATINDPFYGSGAAPTGPEPSPGQGLLSYSFTGVPANLTLWWGLSDNAGHNPNLGGAAPAPLNSISDDGGVGVDLIDEYAGAALFGTGAANFVEYQRTESIECPAGAINCPGSGTVRLEMTTTGGDWDRFDNLITVSALEPASLASSATANFAGTGATLVSGATLDVTVSSTFDATSADSNYDPAPTDETKPYGLNFTAMIYGTYRGANVCE